ncbi:MAG: hypothetical protein FWG85_02235 [Bacteroidetes bacterium]|nr:hypothetical protein [Bacteroidota bacterium]
MKRFAVFGSPIIHSFSPQIYSQLFANNNVDWIYKRILTQHPQNVNKFIEEFALSGANLTAPFKQSIIPFLDSITNDSSNIGAVNTILKHNNKLLGFNTDWEGVLSSLRNYYLKKDIFFDLNNKNILLIGSGNSASSVIYGLKTFFPNCNVNIFNRHKEKAKKLAERFKINYYDTENIFDLYNENAMFPFEKYDIIIITIPNPSIYLSDIIFPKNSILFFANYTDIDYFNKLKQTNKSLILGSKWLKEQAISVFEYYFANDEYCRKVKLTIKDISKELGILKDKNIILTGFSGAGKTFIGKQIAEHFSRRFYDLDKMIEEYFNDSVPNIFRNKGEKVFRKIETKLLSTLKEKRCVISLGAGAIANKNNLKHIKKEFVVYLYADLDTSLSRIKIAERPILIDKTRNEIIELYEQRKFIYFDNSDIIVDSAENSINQIIKELEVVM